MSGSPNIAKKNNMEFLGRDFFMFRMFFYFDQTKFFLYYLKTDEDDQQKPFEERLLGKE